MSSINERRVIRLIAFVAVTLLLATNSASAQRRCAIGQQGGQSSLQSLAALQRQNALRALQYQSLPQSGSSLYGSQSQQNALQQSMFVAQMNGAAANQILQSQLSLLQQYALLQQQQGGLLTTAQRQSLRQQLNALQSVPSQ